MPLNDPGAPPGVSTEQMRQCRSCGYENPGEGEERCRNCWMVLDGIAPLFPADNAPKAWWLRLLSAGMIAKWLPLALILAAVIWWMSAYFQWGPNPSGALTDMQAHSGPGAWSLGRFDAQNTGFTPDQAPVPGQVKWAFVDDKPLESAPVVVDGRVFLTTGDGRTVALDESNGDLLWEYDTGVPSSSSPAVSGDLVIACYTPGLIVALDSATGSPQWSVDLRQPISAAPIIADGTLYFGSGDRLLHALDVTSGEELWNFLTEDWIVSPVAYYDGTVVVASQDSLVYLVDAESGKQQLMFDTGRQRFGGGPTVNGDIVYFSSDRGWVWAIDRLATSWPGQRKWFKVKINLFVWQVIETRPVQPGGLWSKRVGGQIKGLLSVAHDKVIGATVEGQVFARDSQNGGKVWATQLEEPLSVEPTVAGKTVLVGAESGKVFGLDVATGEVLWDFDAGTGQVMASPIVAGDTMYVVTEGGALHAVTASN